MNRTLIVLSVAAVALIVGITLGFVAGGHEAARASQHTSSMAGAFAAISASSAAVIASIAAAKKKRHE